MIYVLQGELTLLHDGGETLLRSGMCAGFAHGGSAHCLLNRSARPAIFLEIGDRLPGDRAEYPEDDLVAMTDAAGKWRFTHKNGQPY